jgi:uncharacterized protein
MKSHLMIAMLGLALLSGVAPGLAQTGPAFDCSKAEHEVEKLICKDAELAARDRKMADVYQQAVRVMGKIDVGSAEAVKTLKAMQRGWIGGRPQTNVNAQSTATTGAPPTSRRAISSSKGRSR